MSETLFFILSTILALHRLQIISMCRTVFNSLGKKRYFFYVLNTYSKSEKMYFSVITILQK